MVAFDGAGSTTSPASDDGPSAIQLAFATICLGWYITVATVCLLGHIPLVLYYSKPPERASLVEHPHITIIRPVKGPETYLYACLASTFQQAYAVEKLHIRFCVASRDDPSLPVLEQLCRDFPDHDVKILVEEEDEALQSGQLVLGPNPKIRNMSSAYREARGLSDFISITDCNVWVGKHTLERMVCLAECHKYVHLTPITIDIVPLAESGQTKQIARGSFGGRIDEMYLSTYHAKFYAAANVSGVTPAVVGKSTMFRISHLDSLTDGKGLDYFSEHICEDQLMGELFWRHKVPEEAAGKKFGRHALCLGDLAIQPLSGVSVANYWGRRVRWIRVRPDTVLLATLVEPSTESLFCSLYGAFAFTTLPFFHTRLGIPPTWKAFACIWFLSVAAWCAMDRWVYCVLQSNASVHADSNTPPFARPGKRRGFPQWLSTWLAREVLAVPIWLAAMCGGKQVDWRGRKFWVGSDMKVHAVHPDSNGAVPRTENGRPMAKRRQD